MAPLTIRIYDDPMLREKAEAIEEITERHGELAADMSETMYEANGIGLAAVQVGVLERLIVVDVKWARAEEEDKPPKRPVVMINPQLIEESVEDEPYDEGCLSLPGLEGEVWRPTLIKVRYRDLRGGTVESEFKGLHARCIQHEIDHLDGVLFIDRMSKVKRRLLGKQLRRLAERNHGASPAEKEKKRA